jgi:hypothetical protein
MSLDCTSKMFRTGREGAVIEAEKEGLAEAARDTTSTEGENPHMLCIPMPANAFETVVILVPL